MPDLIYVEELGKLAACKRAESLYASATDFDVDADEPSKWRKRYRRFLKYGFPLGLLAISLAVGAAQAARQRRQENGNPFFPPYEGPGLQLDPPIWVDFLKENVRGLV